MAMRRIAASRVYINGKEFHNHVVELLDNHLLRHYPLTEELPMTEWLPGPIIIRDDQAFIAQNLPKTNSESSKNGNGSFS